MLCFGLLFCSAVHVGGTTSTSLLVGEPAMLILTGRVKLPSRLIDQNQTADHTRQVGQRPKCRL